ncbi:MAG TPA: TetR/AcrR family transcriptional regulator [Myxococcota bacterium]
MNDRPSTSAVSRVRQVAAAGLPPGGVEGPRRRILEAALLLFARRSFHGTSVRDLAEALNQQPSALYKHFPSKDHVLAALIQVGFATHHQSLLDALLGAGGDPVDQLVALAEENARIHARWPLLAVVVNDELHALPEELLATVIALRDASALLLWRVLERGVADGVFDVVDMSTTAAALSAMGGRIPLWFNPSPEFDVETLARRQALLALRMVGARPRSER